MTGEIDRQRLLKLMHKTASGDTGAFQDLYERTAGHVFAMLRQMLGSDAQAEELLQDTYLAAWTRAADFHVSRGTVMTWLITIARRKAIDVIRRRGRETVTDRIPEQTTGPDEGPQALAMAGSNADQLRLCIEDLDSSQRQSVELAFFRGATHLEVSEALSKPVGTVKSWIRRGLQALKRCLER